LGGTTVPTYPRSLSGEFHELLRTNESARLFLASFRSLIADDQFALDLQLRPGDVLQLYHGTMSPLRIRYVRGTLQTIPNPAFTQLQGFGDLQRVWAVPDSIERMFEAIAVFLSAVVCGAPPDYYANGREGFWQNRLSLTFGADWQPGFDWLLFDREAVLCYANDTERAAFLGPISGPYLDIRRKLRERDSTRWGQVEAADSLGNEVDFLGLGPAGELLCIEVKHSSSTSGVYWGPLQTLAYKDQFVAALPTITEDLNRLIQQKITLGLLPESSSRRLANERRPVVGILAVVEPNDRSGCWQRIAEMFQRYPIATVPIVEFRSSEDLGMLPRRVMRHADEASGVC
jgi:hypothetical protein